MIIPPAGPALCGLEIKGSASGGTPSRSSLLPHYDECRPSSASDPAPPAGFPRLGRLMAQMYLVQFRAALPDRTEFGRAVVCANNKDVAVEMVLAHLALPASRAIASAERIKPGVFVTFKKSIPADGDFERNQSTGTFPNSFIEHVDYTIDMRAIVSARCEDDAIRQAGKALVKQAAGEPLNPRKVLELEVLCDCRSFHPRSPAIELQAVYTHPQIFSGGATRGQG